VTPPAPELLDGEPFCGNPRCRLHVRPGDAGVSGEGNWAVVDGMAVGGGRYDGQMLCDRCGTTLLRDGRSREFDSR
jgi:hypothetical protein